ncbi:MAG: hypothetical protein H6741_07510 [Alphaproteobacteria bacterium]|nr:hypothetical protein [Alphaproteobacteria bacterium]MCB9792562.1 hypothetical protein [Alphaproteobacteria bacterium]
MRLLAILTIPAMLTSCVLAPFFMTPGTDGSSDDEWWLEDDTGVPGGVETGNPYTRPFDPYAVFIGAWTIWDGDRLTGHNLFENDPTSYQDPYITIMFVEEQYFQTYNGLYSCTWTGKIEPIAPADFGGTVMWGAWELGIEFVETDCENFNEAQWGDTTPTQAILNKRIALGYSPMTTSMRDTLRQAVSNWDEDWNDYQPYVFSTWFGFYDDFSGWEGDEVDFTFAYEVNPEGGQVFGADGESVKVEIGGLDEPPTGLLRSAAWMGFYAWVLQP